MLQGKVLARDEPVIAQWHHAGYGRDVHREGIWTLFDLLDSNDIDALMSFLETSKEMSIDPLVVFIDMWKTCRTALAKVLPGAARQLCVSNVIKCVIKHTYKTMLIYYCELPKDAETHRAAREELWDLRYLLLEASPTLAERQRGDVEDLLHTHRGTVLAQAYYCKEAIVALFRLSQAKEEARARRDMIVRRFGDVPELQEVTNLIQGNEFEQMIGYLQRGEKIHCPVHRARATSLPQTQSATA